MRLILLPCLIYLVSCQITVESDSTALKALCATAPFSNLGLCNNTCLTCSSNGYSCASCPAQLSLTNSLCNIDTSGAHNYTVNRYLNTLNDKVMGTDAKNFELSDTGERMNISHVTAICQNSTYEYFMLGLFSGESQVVLSYDFGDSIDQIQVKFNLISVVASLTMYVELNDNSIFSNEFDIFSDLTGTYIPTTGETNYLSLSALTKDSVSSIITQVDTGVKTIITNSVKLKLYVDSTSKQDYVWGFSDLVIIHRSCQTCASTTLLQLIVSLGQSTWVVLVIVIIMSIFLTCAIKLQNIKRKFDFQNKLGASSNNNLPIKAINRVADSLQKSVRTMQKQFKKEDKKYAKLMKKA